jgi:uncharacterized protein YidB (DUF937 family)
MPTLNADDFAPMPGRINAWVSRSDPTFHIAGRAGMTLPDLIAELNQPEAVAAGVPAGVSPLQARRALIQAGLRQTVEDWIAMQPLDARDAWDYATQIRRDDSVLAAAAAALGLSDAEIDDLFTLAATL